MLLLKNDKFVESTRVDKLLSSAIPGDALFLVQDVFEKNSQKPTFMEICPVEDELFHADRRTWRRTDRRRDMTRLIVAFRSFAKSTQSRI